METIWIGLEEPSIYSKDRDTESVHWFNLLAHDNRVAEWNLNNELVGNIMGLPNSSFLPSPDHAKLTKACDSCVVHPHKELQVLQTVRQYDSFLHSSPIQHRNEQEVPDCRFKHLLPSIEVIIIILRS